MSTVTITLRDEDQRFIESSMKSGRYVTESEAVSDAIADIRVKVMVGIEELDRGEEADWNMEDIQAGGRALLASREATV